jgi:competence protein ComEA
MEGESLSGDGHEETGGLSLDGFLQRHKTEAILTIVGLILVFLGLFFYYRGNLGGDSQVEIISGGETAGESSQKVIVEVSGAVKNPGVYQFESGARVEDAIEKAGGITGEADSEWLEKVINRAAKLVDGQKIYIPKSNEVLGKQNVTLSAKNLAGDQSISGGNFSGKEKMININTATLAELDSLPGIGQVYGQSIIDHRPYSSIEELVSKGAIKKSVFEKIRDYVVVY